MESDFKERLSYCPDFWRYVPLDGDKRPFESGWPKKFYTLDEVCTLKKEAIGLHLGPASRTVALDFDGPDSDKTFEHHFGYSDQLGLPETIINTSGRPSHYQLFFEVPDWWHNRVKHIVLKPPKGKKWGNVEIRWGEGKQSVLLGKHPNNKKYNWETCEDEKVPEGEGDGRGFYYWEDHCNPKEQVIKLPPESFLKMWALKSLPEKSARKATPTPYVKRSKSDLIYDSYKAPIYLKKYLQPANNFSDHDTWLEVAMALHYLSQEHGQYWKHFEDLVNWSFDMDNFDEDECKTQWLSFNENIEELEDPIRFGTIGELAKKHPDFVVPKLPEEAKEAKEDKPPRLYTELRQEIYEALTNQDENQYQTLLTELRREFYKAERDIAPQLLKLMREKYSKKKLKVGAIDINQVETLDYLLEGFLPAGEVVHLFAPWGCGKTSLTLGMIRALAEGTGFLDQVKASEPSGSLFIQSDAGASRFKASYLELGMDEDPRFKTDGSPESMLEVWAADSKQGTDSWTCNLQGFEKLMREIPKLGVKTIFIDSVKGMTEGTGYDYASNEHVKALTKTFGMIADLYKVAIVLINHKGTDKQEGSGAKAWSEGTGMVIELRDVVRTRNPKPNEDKEEEPDCRELLIRKDSIGGRRAFKFYICDQRHKLIDPSKLKLDTTDLIRTQLIEWRDIKQKYTCTIGELLMVEGISPASIYRAIDKLPNLIKRVKTGVYKIKA